MAIADRTGTVQNAQTHPRVADGFDKVILLDDDTMKPTLGKKHSEGANLSPGSDPEINGLLTKSLSRCNFLQLICEYGLQPLGCQRSKDSNLDTGYGKLLKFRRSLGRKIMPDREWNAGDHCSSWRSSGEGTVPLSTCFWRAARCSLSMRAAASTSFWASALRPRCFST